MKLKMISNTTKMTFIKKKIHPDLKKKPKKGGQGPAAKNIST